MNRRITALAAAVLVAGLALVGCGRDSDTLWVGSADFTESKLIAEIYAGALRAKGIKVERASLGTREAYVPALRDGSIDLIPDYTGTLLQFLNKKAEETTPDAVYEALKRTVPAPLTVLDRSPAEDKDAVVVTKAFAQRNNVKSIADLAPKCAELVFGGPSEFQQRADGLPGIERTYGCKFKEFRALDTGPVTVKALADDTVQAADIFTTNPAIEENGFVALDDPRNNFAAQNVVPLINSAKATPRVREILNQVSAKLTTELLIELNRAVNAPDKPHTRTVAKEWLAANGLG